jgi:hypothetical protein
LWREKKEDPLHRRERLGSQGNSEGFAKELGLDPNRTRDWFEQGLAQEGYGAEVIRALGTHMLKVLTSARDRKDAHA